MEYLGAKQKNTVWSWCGVNEEERKVYLSVWLDTAKRRNGNRLSYVIQEADWGVDDTTGSISAARKDHDEKLALVFEKGYEPFGYFIEAKDRNARPRQIEETKTGFIFSLELERFPDGTILAYPKDRIEIR
jgi:endo-1,4-beta-mannosidase